MSDSESSSIPSSTSSSSVEFNLEEELARIKADEAQREAEIRAHFKKLRRAEASSSRGPRPKKSYLNRLRDVHGELLMKDYFIESPIYTPQQFRRRFRMHRPLFMRIVEGVTSYDPRFSERPDCTGKLGFTAIQQVTAIIRFFASGKSADSIDEYVRIAESTLYLFADRFMDAMIKVFGPEYLRSPNDVDLHRLLQQAEARGFPGMLGSIDCMHWTWKNCPKAWAGQYQSGFHKKPSIILEAVAGPDTWIWHSFFGVAGSNNDINVLQRSPVLDGMLNGTAPQFEYTINGHTYKRGYFLGDGIYPSYTTFVKSITQPATPQQVLFKQMHERYRKDVERAFGILQARWHIIANPAKGWKTSNLWKIMNTCIIMHNMIVEDERHTYRGIETLTAMIGQYDHPDDEPFVPVYERATMNSREQYHTNNAEIRNRNNHIRLQEDLVQHVWQKFGTE